MPPAAIVIPTDAIGGTEKRLAEVWVHLRREEKGKHLLVVSRPLFDALCSIAGFRPTLMRFRDDVVVHAPAGSARREALLRIIRLKRATVIHVAMAAPVMLGLLPPTPTVFTVPLVTLDMLNARGQLSVVAGAAFASQVDVLDPRVAADLRERLPWKADSIHNTPGSQIDLERWAPSPFAEKDNLIAFCGLLSHAKQAGRFLDVLPELHRGLLAAGVRDVRYALMGRDTDEVRAYARSLELQAAGVPIKAWFEPNPGEVLRRAKVFLSLQTVTNYPSKSLLEAMACGALPVITDVGDSRLVAKRQFAAFIPKEFTAEDLLSHCQRILAAPSDVSDRAVVAAREFLRERFSISLALEYFETLYSKAQASER